jgi:hypothetical protein
MTENTDLQARQTLIPGAGLKTGDNDLEPLLADPESIEMMPTRYTV